MHERHQHLSLRRPRTVRMLTLQRFDRLACPVSIAVWTCGIGIHKDKAIQGCVTLRPSTTAFEPAFVLAVKALATPADHYTVRRNGTGDPGLGSRRSRAAGEHQPPKLLAVTATVRASAIPPYGMPWRALSLRWSRDTAAGTTIALVLSRPSSWPWLASRTGRRTANVAPFPT